MTIQIFIDFVTDSELDLVHNDHSITINLNGLRKKNEIPDDIKKLTTSATDLLFVSSYEKLYHGLQKFFLNKETLSFEQIIILRQKIAEIYQLFKHLKQLPWLASPAKKYDSSQTRAIRYGVIELRVLESYLYAKEELIQQVKLTSSQLKDSTYQVTSQLLDKDKWFTSTDHKFNLQGLMTNAGFILSYDREQAVSDVLNWCEMYFNELRQAEIFVCPLGYPHFIATMQKIIMHENTIQDLNFPAPEEFYKCIAGKNILFMTPFAKLIQKNYASGKIFELYKGTRLPEFKLQTIDMPLCFYPDRPFSSWKDAYQYCCSKINDALASQKFDLFAASAGCYGIPLCHHARKTFGINTLYYGNFLNTLFGVKQKCSESFLENEVNEHAWVKGDLEQRCPQIVSIDGGRYT